MFIKRYRYILILLSILIFLDTSASARRVKKYTARAEILSENESSALSQLVAQELGLKKLTSSTLSLALVLQQANTFEFGKNFYVYENWAEGGKVKFIRLGYLFFIDAKKYSQLSPELKNTLGNNAIIVNNLDNSIIADVYGQAYYTLATITALLNRDLSGKRVIDCGAGEGILSLVASKLGAKFLDLIEISGIKVAKAKANMELNGLKENSDYNLIYEDLKDTDKVANQLSKSDLETVVISNIGTWPKFYNVTNQDSMQLLPLIPNANTFIAGGYNTLLNKGAIKQDKKAIRSMGFVIERYNAEFGEFFGKFVAWIAIKEVDR